MSVGSTLLRADAALARGYAAAHGWFARRLSTPLPHAAGRAGLFRIVYSLFYLWWLSRQQARYLADIPGEHRIPILLLRYWPGWPGPVTLGLLECSLVALLVLLLVGCWTRVMTAGVLVVGVLLESFFFSVDQEHATTMMAFYIPAFMLVCAAWGDTYSLDALARQRRGLLAVGVERTDRPYVMPIWCVLTILAALIFTSGVYKITLGGTWLRYDDVLGYLFVHKNLESAREGLPMNPIAPLVEQQIWIGWTLQVATLLLEFGFPLVLCGRKLRHLMIASILLFHAVNAIWMATTFTPVLIVYGLFIDWEWLRQRLLPRASAGAWAEPGPAWGLRLGAVGAAVAAGLLFNSAVPLREVMNLGGALNWRTMWFPILPLSLGWLAWASWELVRPVVGRGRGGR